ncbi:ComF family protein [bacterium]|nr:ComF family protein [bacterium]
MKCAICKAKTSDPSHICHKCREKILKRPRYQCKFCHTPLNIDIGLCYFCKKTKYSFDEIFHLGYYKMEMGDLVKKIKFRESIKLAHYLGIFMGEELQKKYEELDYIFPIPIGNKRFHERGFDQALEIAKGVRKILHLPIKTNIIKKNEISPLEDMKRVERYKTMSKAFYLDKKSDEFNGKNILIIDDVFTTGATTNNFAKILKKLRPKRVIVSVLAR